METKDSKTPKAGTALETEKHLSVAQRVLDAGRFIAVGAKVSDVDADGNVSVELTDRHGNKSHVGGVLAKRIANAEDPKDEEF